MGRIDYFRRGGNLQLPPGQSPSGHVPPASDSVAAGATGACTAIGAGAGMGAGAAIGAGAGIGAGAAGTARAATGAGAAGA